MLIGKKIRLIPTEEQEVLFRKSCGVARRSYNYCLSRKQEVYNNWKKDNSKDKYKPIKPAVNCIPFKSQL